MSDKMLTEQIESLHGETLALQSILFWLLYHLQRNSPDPIAAALDDAANLTESTAIGGKSSPRHAAKSLEIVEQFRAAIVRGKGPQHRV